MYASTSSRYKSIVDLDYLEVELYVTMVAYAPNILIYISSINAKLIYA